MAARLKSWQQHRSHLSLFQPTKTFNQYYIYLEQQSNNYWKCFKVQREHSRYLMYGWNIPFKYHMLTFLIFQLSSQQQVYKKVIVSHKKDYKNKIWTCKILWIILCQHHENQSEFPTNNWTIDALKTLKDKNFNFLNTTIKAAKKYWSRAWFLQGACVDQQVSSVEKYLLFSYRVTVIQNQPG